MLNHTQLLSLRGLQSRGEMRKWVNVVGVVSEAEYLPYPRWDAERLLSLGECRSCFFLKHQRSSCTEFPSFYSVCLTQFIFSFLFFYCYYFGPAMGHVKSSLLDHGLSSRPLHWKHSVPTTGPLGKSKILIFRAVLGSQKNWAECTKGSHIPLALIHA